MEFTHELVRPEKSALEKAHEMARKTFKFFWREMSWEERRVVKGVSLEVVKVFLSDDNGDGDHVWVQNVQFDGNIVMGTLINKPLFVEGYDVDDIIGFEISELEDWIYCIGGKVCGGFTVDLIRAEMSAAERASHDERWGLQFGELGKIFITPSHTYEELNIAEREEHPMCINMIPSVNAMLVQAPSVISDVDEDGWMMVQRDALSGNASVVELLVKAGANAHQKNENGLGNSAYDLAKMADWPLVLGVIPPPPPS